MLKGISTLVEYDQCIKKGLCEEHLKELNQVCYFFFYVICNEIDLNQCV